MTTFFRIIPALVVIIVLFALLQLYGAAMFAIHRNYPFAALYGVLSFAGVALARALWVQRKSFLARRQ